MANKILVLNIRGKSLRLAARFHDDEIDEDDEWKLIDEEGNEGRGTTRMDEIEDEPNAREEFASLKTSIANLRDELRYAVHGMNEAIADIQKAIDFKDLELKYPKHENLADRQDAEALLASAKNGAEPTFPVRTKPVKAYENITPMQHDTHPRPRTQLATQSVDYEAARAKSAAQAANCDPAEMLTEAESNVDAELLPKGVCGLCKQPTPYPVCASCKMAIDSFDPHFFVPLDAQLTRVRAMEINAWLTEKREIEARIEDQNRGGMPF